MYGGHSKFGKYYVNRGSKIIWDHKILISLISVLNILVQFLQKTVINEFTIKDYNLWFYKEIKNPIKTIATNNIVDI